MYSTRRVSAIRFVAFLCCAFWVSCNTAPDTGREFDSFWSSFRQAMLAERFDAVEAMSSVPLEVRGSTDEDAIRAIERDQFNATLKAALEQDSGDDPEGETVRGFLERTHVPSPGAIATDGQSARVGSFVFEIREGRWRLARLYLDGNH